MADDKVVDINGVRQDLDAAKRRRGGGGHREKHPKGADLPPGCPVTCLGCEGDLFWFLDARGQLRSRQQHQFGMSAEAAMVVAALKNIAEGTGTAVDAARVLRLIDANPHLAQIAGDLPPLPPQSALVRDARALAQLGEDAWRLVLADVVPENYAAHVGRMLDDAAQQVAALQVLARAKPRNAVEARLIVEDIRAAGFETTTQESLFGCSATTTLSVTDSHLGRWAQPEAGLRPGGR